MRRAVAAGTARPPRPPAPALCFRAVWSAASSSSSRRTLTGCTPTLSAWARSSISRRSAAMAGLSGLIRTAARVRPGVTQLHELEALRVELSPEERRARDVPARARVARDDAALDGIADDGHHDGDGRRRLLRREGRGSPLRDDDVDLQADQLGGEGGQPLVLAVGPPVLDREVLARHVSVVPRGPGRTRPRAGRIPTPRHRPGSRCGRSGPPAERRRGPGCQGGPDQVPGAAYDARSFGSSRPRPRRPGGRAQYSPGFHRPGSGRAGSNRRDARRRCGRTPDRRASRGTPTRATSSRAPTPRYSLTKTTEPEWRSSRASRRNRTARGIVALTRSSAGS